VAGLRAGWICAAENVIERLARVKTAFELGSPLLTQAIAVQLIAAIPEARRLRRIQLIPRRRALVDLLKKIFQTGSSEPLPEVSFFGSNCPEEMHANFLR
jgi:DNA-binding transcriptional MocR family regulator